jgi:hypothetical protein
MTLQHNSAAISSAIGPIGFMIAILSIALAIALASSLAAAQEPAPAASAGQEGTPSSVAANSGASDSGSTNSGATNSGATHADPANPAPTGIDLAPLLGGVENQCQYSASLERFWRTLPDPEQALRALTPQLQAAVGPISVTDEVDFRMFSIPVRGAWHQVPVKQIQFGLGKGNGIHVLLVEFAAPAEAVQAVFEPLVARSRAAMEQDPDNTLAATTDLFVESGKARLICDLST